jgi:2-oxoglutarate ferredoxin oxidoreductase subunit delta
VAFCPKNVLALANGKVVVDKQENCIGCRLCEMRCPDFAIEIHDVIDAADDSPEVSKMDFSIPPEVQ